MTAVNNTPPRSSFHTLAALAAGGAVLAFGGAAIHDKWQSYQQTQAANARGEAAIASSFCGRHDALNYMPQMQKSLETAASQINPALKSEVGGFLGSMTYALGQPGIVGMPVYGNGIYAYVPATREGANIAPIQVLMQTADNQCVAFGLTGRGEIVAPEQRLENATSFRPASSHGQAPACDRALKSLVNVPSV